MTIKFRVNYQNRSDERVSAHMHAVQYREDETEVSGGYLGIMMMSQDEFDEFCVLLALGAKNELATAGVEFVQRGSLYRCMPAVVTQRHGLPTYPDPLMGHGFPIDPEPVKES